MSNADTIWLTNGLQFVRIDFLINVGERKDKERLNGNHWQPRPIASRHKNVDIRNQPPLSKRFQAGVCSFH